MITIICALYAEAQPFIEQYSLKKRDKSPFSSFYNEQIELIISGINPYNAAIATTYMLTKQNQKPRIVLNFGICGSYRKEDTIGKAYQIKKIVDKNSQKVYHLQNQKKLLQTADITTFHTPQNTPQKHKAHLIDMESSGFYMAAGKFVEKENIYIFKIVSDHGATTIPDNQTVVTMTKPYISVIEQL